MTDTPRRPRRSDGLLAWYTLREYAELTCQHIEAVRSQADRGAIPTARLGKKTNGKKIIMTARLAADFPDLLASILLAGRHKTHRPGGAN